MSHRLFDEELLNSVDHWKGGGILLLGGPGVDSREDIQGQL